MAYSLIWLPDVLLKAGCKVSLVDGWETRGIRDMKEIFGVICHHTATSDTRNNFPTYRTILDGRRDAKGRVELAGPLAHLGLGRDGTYYVFAAGKCNHAGAGAWKEVVNGNSNFIGIEAENTGTRRDFPWPEVQLEAYQRGVAAILNHIGQPVDYCVGHKEYALPQGRKNDPNFDMHEFRKGVTRFMAADAPPPTFIPNEEPNPEEGQTPRPTLRRVEGGHPNQFVMKLQDLLGIAGDGLFGAKTEAAVRVFQRNAGLVADGIVGPKTWKALDKIGVAEPVVR
jgi:hypothetical protein